MKAVFQFGLATVTGKNGEMVYCLNRASNTVYVRQYVYPTLSEHHHRMGNKAKNIFAIQPSTGYKDDLRMYLMRYHTLRRGGNLRITTWAILYSKLMNDMAKADPSIDLLTLTKDEIYLRDLPCISVKRAVQAGLLPEVYEWEGYDKPI